MAQDMHNEYKKERRVVNREKKRREFEHRKG
jgi:hypothetical protein